MEIFQKIKVYYNNASVIVKIIMINAFVFIVSNVLSTLGFLGQVSFDLEEYFYFPADINLYYLRFWSIFTYIFFHRDLFHLLFNMMWLYFFGNIFLNIHTTKRFVNLYVLGAIFGALLYMFAYTVLPVFVASSSALRGASAAVSAVMVAATLQVPNKLVRFMFIPVNLKLWWITLGFLIMDFVRIQSGNSGGHIAHLGGALIGYVYMVQLQKGNDIGLPIEKFIDWCVTLFRGAEKKNTFRKVYRNKSKKATKKKSKDTIHSKSEHQKTVDAILEKISKNGYESLSKKEKEMLFKSGNKL